MTDSIDTFGWDTVYGIRYEYLNKSLEKQQAKLPDFTDWSDVESGLQITGSWNNFQVAAGGAGRNLQLLCKLNSGKTSEGEDLTGSWLKIQVNLATIANAAYPATDKTGSGGTMQTMQVNSAGTAERPAVSVIDSAFPGVSKPLVKQALPSIFQQYFIQHVAQFKAVFAAVELNVTAEKSAYQWLKPGYSTYACADLAGGQPGEGIFAVLNKTEKGSPDGLTPQVDSRLFQSLPAGSDAALAISAEKLLQHVFLQGAMNVIPGSKAEDFEINNNNLWIVNKNDVTWGNFTLENGKILTPVIKANNFQIGLAGNTLQLQIIDATAKLPGWDLPGEIDLHMNITQEFEFRLKQKANGEYVLIPKPELDGPSVKEITSTVTISKDLTIFEICIGIGMSFIGSVLGGGFNEFFNEAESIAVESALEGTIKLTEEAIKQVIEHMGEQAVEEAELAAAGSAATAMMNSSHPEYTAEFDHAIAANKWKIFGAAMQGLLALPSESIPDLIKLVAAGETEKLPSFSSFADNASMPISFPGSTGLNLKTAGLNGPFLLAGNLQQSDQ